MTPNETEAFAALRMQVAHLHNALKGAREQLEGHLTESQIGIGFLRDIDAALELSEPELRTLVLAIDQDEGALAKLRCAALSAAAAGVRAHHHDVEKARAAGAEGLEHANSQLQGQGRTLSALAAAARVVVNERASLPDPPPKELAPLCKAIAALAGAVPG